MGRQPGAMGSADQTFSAQDLLDFVSMCLRSLLRAGW
jgi:hypothetical protein